MDSAEILSDLFERVRDAVYPAVQGLDTDQLSTRLDGQANTISWLVWHLARVQDHHVADASGSPEVWVSQGWSDRFNLPFDPQATGYGHGPDEVGALRADADLLTAYYDAVHARTMDLVGSVSATALDRVVDTSWDPAVTLGVRLVSVAVDDLQHAGQAAFIRGIIERSASR